MDFPFANIPFDMLTCNALGSVYHEKVLLQFFLKLDDTPRVAAVSYGNINWKKNLFHRTCFQVLNNRPPQIKSFRSLPVKKRFRQL